MCFKRLLAFFSFILVPLAMSSQDAAAANDLERTFMPQFQLGYVFHPTEDLSGGLITQTSIEYRDISNLVFRVNYDVLNTSMNLEYPLNDSTRFTGKTTLSDLIGGIGYRLPLEKHNVTGYIQAGLRFYGYPIFNLNDDEVTIDLSNQNLGVMRYTIGYEYALSHKLFLSLELISSHVLNGRDFWEDSIWSHGLTFGITSPLF